MMRFMNWKRNGFITKIRFLSTVIAAFLILSSCIDDPPTYPEINDYQSYINLVWELYDQKYVAFDTKDCDWNAVHDEYSQLAENIKSDDELLDLITEMIGELEDKNAFIIDMPIPGNHTIYPTYSPEIEVNYVDSVMMELLEPWDFKWILFSDRSWGYCVIDSIPYFAIGHFNMFFRLMHFTIVLKEHLDAPGIIIDIRMSDDESLAIAELIPGFFTDQSGIVFFSQHRTGPEHDDLSSLTIHDAFPKPWAFTKPIVLLAGEQNVGAAEAFASIMEQMPHVTIIGDTTGGAGNTPGDLSQIYWPLWNNCYITCPFARVLTADTVSIEGNGILPDIYVHTTPADFLAGHDPVLEYAIEWIAEETAP